ncbi:DNA translocase FtsK [Radiobacillus sp. PE A8.2]|uniref:FtsK/SpoIIIE family DNA translocase n=1 Tax=Radiobacillus sp. PE A8.2 TaxID=3380349 RepID=UPI00388F263B
MAKKRNTRKSQPKLKQQIKYELIGILFLFLAVFGSGASSISEGAIPGIIENLFRFFFGIWFPVGSVFLSWIGIYLIIKRQIPYLFNKRIVGFYIIFLAILLITHIQTYEVLLADSFQTSILRETASHIMAYVQNTESSANLGGGIIGALLLTFSYFLFSVKGAQILAFFSLLIGAIFITEISIGDLLVKLWGSSQNHWKAQKKRWKKYRSDKKKRTVSSNIKTDPLDVTDEHTIDIGEEVQENKDFPDIAYSIDNVPKQEPKEKEDTKEEQTSNDEVDHDIAASLPMAETENYEYQLPPIELLAEPKHNAQHQERGQIQAVVRKLERTFHSFGVKAKVTKVHVGPAVTKYEVYPDIGVKVSKIVNLHDDLALALAAKDIRIEAPIPGKSAIGIEVPNQEVAMVSLREVLETKKLIQGSKLSFALGRDISGESVTAELNKMPHLLVAGATGSGKSVCINGIITSILMRAKPHEVKMMMIDPKKVELNVYNGIPHLLAPVVTDPKKASRALKKVVSEMERRYDLFSDTGTRNIEAYNEYIKKSNLAENDNQPQLPYIVVLVDELADLMMVASNDVEDAITRLAQMARAAGIHLIIATQRPSVDVITGVIKANIPSRIAFSVSSQTDSRTILDSGGAEKLLGQGDMLFIPVGSSKPTRIQGAFLSDEEVERIVDFCIDQQKAQYQEEMIPDEETEVTNDVDDDLFDDAVQLITEIQSASVSMLQRRFRIGYTRAARLIDAMEARGIVGPYEGSKPRTVLISETTEEKSS